MFHRVYTWADNVLKVNEEKSLPIIEVRSQLMDKNGSPAYDNIVSLETIVFVDENGLENIGKLIDVLSQVEQDLRQRLSDKDGLLDPETALIEQRLALVLGSPAEFLCVVA